VDGRHWLRLNHPMLDYPIISAAVHRLSSRTLKSMPKFLSDSRGQELLPAFERWERAIASRQLNPYRTASGRYSAYWRTIITNRYRGADARRHGGHTVPPSDYNMAYELWIGRRGYPEDVREATRLNLLVATFKGMAGRATTQRAFVITDLGFLGMAPETTRIGDMVCVFQGGEVPFVMGSGSSLGSVMSMGSWMESVKNARPEDVQVLRLS
ncbi:hypothetical protein BDZ97DRAFT_1837719, partial [Flammula alnicola]